MRATTLILTVPPLVGGYVVVVLLALDLSNTYAQYLLIVPLAYLLGAIPWGLMMTRLSRGIDIRGYGSGRIGTANVLRAAGGRLAALVLILDISKGVLALFLARAAADTAIAEVVAGLLVLLGHNWSLFIGFKGGRGIATGAGGLGVVSPVALGMGLAAFALVTLTSRYLSLASLAAAVTAIVVLSVQTVRTDLSSAFLIYGAVGGLMIIWQHRDNIQRLVQGNERRLGQLVRSWPTRSKGRCQGSR